MDPQPWDIDAAPLARGVTLLEASAGTGKTWNIQRLVALLIAEHDLPIAKILVVTFTKAAAAELRDKVRAILLQLAAQTGALAHGSPVPGEPDPLLPRLQRSPLGIAVVHERLTRASREFGTAPISTIHGFCQQVLKRSGAELGVRLDAELVDSADEVIAQIVDDYLSRERYGHVDAARWVAGAKLKRKPFLKLGATLAEHPQDELVAPVAVVDGQTAEIPAQTARQVAVASQRALAALFVEARRLWIDEGQFAEILRFFETNCRVTLNGTSHKLPTIRRQLQSLDVWLHGNVPSAMRIGEPQPETKHFGALQFLKGAALPAIPAAMAVIAELLNAVEDERARGTAAILRHAAAHLRAEIPRGLQARNQRTFTDLLYLVRDALAAEAHQVPPRHDLATQLGSLYDAALIDEFQDTDTAQWDIFRMLFLAPEARQFLFLVGDPKQSIYRFRGADIDAYLAAAALTPAHRQYTLTVNHRSDRPLVEQFNRLYRQWSPQGSTERPEIFGDDRIRFPLVSARNDQRMAFAPDGPLSKPLCVRYFQASSLPDSAEFVPTAALAAQLAAKWVTLDIVARLGTKVGDPPTVVSAGDIAVLVDTNKQATLVQRSLARANVAAVISTDNSVADTPEARWMCAWLAAVDQPNDDSLARQLAITPLFGWTAAELVAVDDDASKSAAAWLRYREALRAWKKAYDSKGFVRAWHQALANQHACGVAVAGDNANAPVWTRLLAAQDGDRCVTNLRHLMELLQARWLKHKSPPAGLAQWLQRLASDDEEKVAGQTEIRLETDAAAVKIVTIHKAKGLQYPIVFVPFLFMAQAKAPSTLAVCWPEPGGANKLVLDDGGALRTLANQQDVEAGKREGLRKLYVAVTRALHQCVVYWGLAGPTARGRQSVLSPLAALFHGEQQADAPPKAKAGAPAAPWGRMANGQAVVKSHLKSDGAKLFEWVEAHFAASAMDVALSRCDAPPTPLPRWTGATDGAVTPTTTDFTRPELSEYWRTWSYSALGKSHLEPALPSPPATATPVELDGPSMAGKEFGKWVHAVFEHLEFEPQPATNPPQWQSRAVSAQGIAVPPLPLLALVEQLGDKHGQTDTKARAVLADTLPAILQTPLGVALGELRLCDLKLQHRKDELVFDFSLAAGSAATRAALLDPIRRRAGAGGDAPAFGAAYARALDARDNLARQTGAAPAKPMLGLFTGSIDLVFRTGANGVYYVVDYKTNRLAAATDSGGPRAASCYENYGSAGLQAEMIKHNYILQYHLYLCALHTWLGGRLDGYSYANNIGGALYLFVRGMAPRQPRQSDGWANGVFFDKPPEHVIAAMCATLGLRGHHG